MPVVIVLMGLPGSGKTTVAELLAARSDLSVVSRDAIRDAMFRPCAFTELEKDAAYRALLLAVGACLKLGRSCVVEGMPFSRSDEVEETRSLAEAAGAFFLPVFLHCPVELAQARARSDLARQNRAPPKIGTSTGSPAWRSALIGRRLTLCASTRRSRRRT
jgi:predicted kinase